MNKTKEQIEDWLSKLERESWQLELLVSAFTIFLLIGALSSFDAFMVDVTYQYNLSTSVLVFVFMFLILIQKSLLALIISLVIHLTLRGFWIGTIGLRSVQSDIDFGKLNYNEFFTEKLKKKVISLDQLVIKLDEICSVIFAFSFLVISILMAVGMYTLFLGIVGVALSYLINLLPSVLNIPLSIFSLIIFLTIVITGFIYMVDYFTLGFFKRVKWISKAYYPFYQFYNFITLSALSRSIYYYLISKFSKRKIRLIYGVTGFIILFLSLVNFDQYQYFPDDQNDYLMSTNSYDDQRSADKYVEGVSIASGFVDRPHFQVFLRYNARDNGRIRTNCPDLEPLKDDGLNWNFTTTRSGANFQIGEIDYSDQEVEELLACQSSIYQLSVNDSIYSNLNFYFYVHPSQKQKGLITTIPTAAFINGENLLKVDKVKLDSLGNAEVSPFAKIPFWYHPR